MTFWSLAWCPSRYSHFGTRVLLTLLVGMVWWSYFVTVAHAVTGGGGGGGGRPLSLLLVVWLDGFHKAGRGILAKYESMGLYERRHTRALGQSPCTKSIELVHRIQFQLCPQLTTSPPRYLREFISQITRIKRCRLKLYCLTCEYE